MRGARARAEREGKQALQLAYYQAAWSRADIKFPKLGTVMSGGRRASQTPDEMLMVAKAIQSQLKAKFSAE